MLAMWLPQQIGSESVSEFFLRLPRKSNGFATGRILVQMSTHKINLSAPGLFF